MAILAFHNVDDTIPLGVNYFSPRRLKRLIIHLSSEGYYFLSLGEYLECQDTVKKIAVTFDDGYDSFYYKVLPVLMELSIPAAIFVPFNLIGKANDWDYMGFLHKTKHINERLLKEIAGKGVEIGSHGSTHTCLAGMSSRFLKLELANSKKGLENIIGRDVKYISYPFGRFDEEVEKRALEAGYVAGFSLSYIKRSRSGFTRPRSAIYYFDTAYSVSQKIGNAPLGQIEKIKGAILNSYAYGTVLLNKIRPRNSIRPT
jgi:peptidoglycan/xylan/chitin deacetylase (PgdA/CDA1 family)